MRIDKRAAYNDRHEERKREMADELTTYNCRIAHDEQMVRGGARIDDDTYEVDATLPTRWARTIAKLGLRNDWLARDCHEHGE